jgi:phage terminase large subunit GpA-like protein
MGEEIRGSTTIVELLRRYPNGDAARLMSRLHWPCPHCGGAFHEPLTLAAKRHRNDPRTVLSAFRALDAGGPTEEEIRQAARKVVPST